jgi:hypothetical protein
MLYPRSLVIHVPMAIKMHLPIGNQKSQRIPHERFLLRHDLRRDSMRGSDGVCGVCVGDMEIGGKRK